ncbi:hypothetical protein [Endozoicomonas atrinae]|uniref:hypothetical protein n=1 Tax=Endozoicomonas atrinae TaxID=1333660 RepID=UPI000824EF0D|nr:hypothetical protein [Endozoicomonas atrinae]
MTTTKTTSKKTTTNKKEGTTMAKDKMERNSKSKKSSEERFVETVNIRMPKALRLIERVSELADKSKYEYTAEQADKIKDALQSALDELVKKFENGEQKEEPVFKL